MSSVYSILTLLAGAVAVEAHGYVYSWTIDGETHPGFNPDGQQGYSGAERPTDNSQVNGNGWGPAARNTGQVACGGDDPGSGLESWPIKGGSTVVVEWSDPKNGETVWPPAHVGPISGYMAKCPGATCDGVPADSLNWFKIDQTTYDGTQWPAEKITAGEDYTFAIPIDLAPGAYLLRHEILALHFAWDESAGEGFENYPYCIQTILEGNGTAVPTDTVTFPAVYDPANYAWYDYSVPWDPRDPNDYVPPGPAVYTGGGPAAPSAAGYATSSGSATATSTVSAASTGIASAGPSGSPGSGENTLPVEPIEEPQGDVDEGGEAAIPSRPLGNELSVEPTGVDNDAEEPVSPAPTPRPADASSAAPESANDASISRQNGGWGGGPTGSKAACDRRVRETGVPAAWDDDANGDMADATAEQKEEDVGESEGGVDVRNANETSNDDDDDEDDDAESDDREGDEHRDEDEDAVDDEIDDGSEEGDEQAVRRRKRVFQRYAARRFVL